MEDKEMRKYKAGNESSTKKKKEREPQRGLGVAKLERLRAQENLKRMAQISNLPFNFFMESSMPHQGLTMNNNGVVPGTSFPPTLGSCEGNNNNKVGVGHFCGDQGLFVQRVDGFNGVFPGKNGGGAMVGFSGIGYGSASNMKMETSNELYSTPPASTFWALSDKCGFCHKKKRVDGIAPNQSVEVEVEVVAVHKKGGLCGGVIMEYEFLPEKGGRSRSSSSFIMTASGGGDTVVETSTSVDLSLKLYC